VSSSQRQGFANPARYTVLHDSTDEPLYKLHQLSYKLCHSYFNIANAVKSPSPILYARKLAKFMAEHSKDASAAGGGQEALGGFGGAFEANYAKNSTTEASNNTTA